MLVIWPSICMTSGHFRGRTSPLLHTKACPPHPKKGLLSLKKYVLGILIRSGLSSIEGDFSRSNKVFLGCNNAFLKYSETFHNSARPLKW